tara:strand:- start:3367 stop:4152 length:786 start_codon:yes stop_codon:yes gene_type:complete
MSVNSKSNKELLYELLYNVVSENGFLVDIFTLQSFIDEQCLKFNQNKHLYNGLSDINKLILDNTYKFLLENQLKQTQNISEVNDKDLFDKKNNFDNNFKIVKENFENMITLKKPEEINFEDDEDDVMPPENLESIMNQTLADREKELKNITQKYSDENKQKAQDWINKDNPVEDNKEPEKPKVKLTILDKNSSSKEKKHVRFEEPLETFNIFNKLKKKSNIDNVLIKKLEDKIDKVIVNQTLILKQQDEILEILNKTNKTS